MKTLITIMILISSTIHAQDSIANQDGLKRSIADAAVETEKSKSGNYRDAFNSFFQLVSNNLTNEEKSLELNFTLFDIKSIFNEKLQTDYGYVNEIFSRNLQFNLKGNFDGEFKEAGYTGGITYALINKRDEGLAEFTKEITEMYNRLVNDMDSITTQIMNSESFKNSSPQQKSAKIIILQRMVHDFLNERNVLNEDSEIYNQFTTFVNNNYTSAFMTQSGNPLSNSQAIAKELNTARTAYYENLDKKPLWTVYADGSVDSGSFSGASIGTTYLQGGKRYEIDTRAKFSYVDTLATGKTRNEFNIKAGVNFKIWIDKQKRSRFEVKTYGEYNSILKNVLSDEDKNTFLANVDFRIRLSDDLWLPITIKYDIENSNFLGFLNITYNFETKTD